MIPIEFRPVFKFWLYVTWPIRAVLFYLLLVPIGLIFVPHIVMEYYQDAKNDILRLDVE